MADGDVSLYSERCYGARGRVDPEILKVGDAQASIVAKHPRSEDAVRDGGKASGCQHHQVCHSQTDQIAVGWSPHMFGGEHHQNDHNVANDPQNANHEKQETTYHFILGTVVRPVPQSAVEHRYCCKVFHLTVLGLNRFRSSSHRTSFTRDKSRR